MRLLFTIIFLITIVFNSGCTEKTSGVQRVPEWSKNAVWYQIFPERFFNGDTLNDPKSIDMQMAWPYFIPEGWEQREWTSDWYQQAEWEKKSGLDFYGATAIRRYGGDIEGIIQKLDYLNNLGVNAIYLNPVFESPSQHKYDATMYHHIDNNFGPDPEGDRKIWAEEDFSDPATWKWTSADKLFLELIAECHKRDMKIIIDGVFNHVGTSFWAFQDVIKKQQKSEYKDWFTIKKWENPETDENEFDYEGWVGIKDLPELKEDENGLIEPVKKHIFDIVRRWMDPNGDGDPSDGIDGWRLDVAEMVNIKFWKEFRKHVKSINPEAYLTGEIWWDDWSQNKMFNARPWLRGDAFDGVMNYRFTHFAKLLSINLKDKITPSQFADSLSTLYRDYEENAYSVMGMLGSHDTERFTTLIKNRDNLFDHYSRPEKDINYNIENIAGIERELQKMIIGLQFTLPGAPMIYYGDEAGMWGPDDPDCRKPMVWPDKKYDTEKVHPYGKERKPDSVYYDNNLYSWYKTLVEIRQENSCLKTGGVKFEITDDKNNVLMYKRYDNAGSILVLINNNDVKINYRIKNTGLNEMKDLISKSSIDLSKELELQPYQILILEGIK